MTTTLIIVLTLAGLFMTYKCYKLEKDNKELKEKHDKNIEFIQQLIKNGVLDAPYLLKD